MPHTRDLKIAKLLHHTISEFFVKHAPDLDLYIESVEMADRRNADISYRLGFNTSLSEQSIRELHEQIMARKPQLKKYLAEQMQLKNIPKLHFHVNIHE